MRKKQCLKYGIFAFMGIQIVLGILWMLKNITAIPIFGDTSEYLELSETFIIDEYRQVGYPLFLHIIRNIAAFCHLPYQVLLYIAQTVICYGGITFVWGAVRDSIGWKKILWKDNFICLYILCIPMVTFLNFSVLTDSLALSLMLIMMGAAIQFLTSDTFSKKYFIYLFISFFLDSIVRVDRMYVCFLFLILFALVLNIVSVKKGRLKRIISKKFCLFFAMLCCSVLMVKGVNAVTQTPGSHGRISSNYSNVLLNRIVWPNMEVNYNEFSEDIKNIITLEDAKIFDEHNNNIMYYLLPKLIEKVGEEKAREMCNQMTLTVICNQPVKVITDTIEDFLCFVFMPIGAWTSNLGISQTACSWNVYCCSTVTPILTNLYSKYYNFEFGLFMFIITLVVIIIYRKRDDVKKVLQAVMPLLGISIITGLAFSAISSAPPNDRYALICYVSWGILFCGIWKSIAGNDE